MTDTTSHGFEDRTAAERRKDLSGDEIRALELAGGTEGGMQAGSAGGPGQKANVKADGTRSPGGSAKAD